MKLKSLLITAFLTLTLIPIAVVSVLLYWSGFNLSKESYSKNLTESIHVQVDYISQVIENNMILDGRFAERTFLSIEKQAASQESRQSMLITELQSYLQTSEDKISACLFLDEKGASLYNIGEKKVIEHIREQLPDLSKLDGQQVLEFELEQGIFSLGVVTPVWNQKGTYLGSMVSVYDKSFVFKILSSYYEVSDTQIYICRSNGAVIELGKLSDSDSSEMIKQTMETLEGKAEGTIDTHINGISVSGYYKNIYITPWYVVGFIDDNQIYDFVNRFALAYILIAVGVSVIGILCSVYFSQRVVEPINELIKMMDRYENTMDSKELSEQGKGGYFETRYLRKRFVELMGKIILTQHNFEGIYQLYQSNDMDDTNIDIDVKAQIITSNKEVFQKIMNQLELREEACIVERFTNCFCEKDRDMLMEIFTDMRDKHLSAVRETEVYTPFLNERWYHTLVVPMYEDERLSRLFIQLRDISNLKRQEVHSIEQARRDALTGLYNRSGFLECVNDILAHEGEGVLHGVLFIDMNYFKMVNDNFGHGAGDELLQKIARTLLKSAGPDDVAGRIGGDEFVLFLSDTTIEFVEKVKEQINKRLIYPFQTCQGDFTVSASIGSAIWNHDSSQTLEELLNQADQKMYEAKREFKLSKQ